MAIGAAIGANCEPCLKYHYAQARKAGAGTGAIAAAVRLAQTVKDTPARSVLEAAARLLGASPQDLAALAGQPGRGGSRQGEPAAEAAGAAGVTAETAAGQAAAEGGCCGGPADLTLTPAPRTQAAAPGTPCCGGESEGVAALAAADGEGGCCG